MSDPTSVSRREILFACRAPEADRVFLAGTFNDWDPAATEMQRDPSGTWFLSLQLDPGDHEYRFVVDGEWCCETGARTVPNAFGSVNSVITVDE
ncbi:MAG: glycogen-binding domain-containing protein [Acidobacteria bacterium]|nr:glycogen-binding domain-containing protein [Acidobacteriota bacterium]